MNPQLGTRLLADIGGTNVRFALQRESSPATKAVVLAVEDYSNLGDALDNYLSRIKPKEKPRQAAFAVAGPVTGDIVALTNSLWSFSISKLRKNFGFERLEVINDFTAVALAIPHLTETGIRKVGKGRRVKGCPIGVIGPGTGLGVSGLMPTPSGWIPLASEGGHVAAAPLDHREREVVSVLQREHDRVPAELILSGSGLVRLYQTIGRLEGEKLPKVSPEIVTARAISGDSPIAAAAVEMFCAMLGTVASNLALTIGGRGGIYLAGGIVPSFGKAFDRSAFRERFESNSHFAAYQAIPTYVVTHPTPAFVGLGHLLDRK